MSELKEFVKRYLRDHPDFMAEVEAENELLSFTKPTPIPKGTGSVRLVDGYGRLAKHYDDIAVGAGLEIRVNTENGWKKVGEVEDGEIITNSQSSNLIRMRSYLEKKKNLEYSEVWKKLMTSQPLTVEDQIIFDMWHSSTSSSEKQRFYEEYGRWK